jgi:hypothetical protein
MIRTRRRVTLATCLPYFRRQLVQSGLERDAPGILAKYIKLETVSAKPEMLDGVLTLGLATQLSDAKSNQLSLAIIECLSALRICADEHTLSLSLLCDF